MKYEKTMNWTGTLLVTVAAIFRIFHLAPYVNYSFGMIFLGLGLVIGAYILKQKELEKQIKELQQ